MMLDADYLIRYVMLEDQMVRGPPKPPTIRNSYTRTLVLDTIMKLSGTIGVTQKTMTFDTHVCQILEAEDIHPTS